MIFWEVFSKIIYIDEIWEVFLCYYKWFFNNLYNFLWNEVSVNNDVYVRYYVKFLISWFGGCMLYWRSVDMVLLFLVLFF